MKYKIAAVIALLGLAVLTIGDGYLRTRRTERRLSTLKSQISGMSIQQLARAVAECDAVPPARRAPAMRKDEAYCEEVARAIEAEPMHMVTVPRAGK